ncbi:1-deoxy-D-xylulose-5-phosphate reductoisomerase [Marinicella litoralis]|uniref:1-deoxy-D-xylulose 5-phosphate reductoisomerase n=1 Tax=Marinicella litoralis TaxID=644220 RepID=A0A4R6XIZ9_9GAMM|nr:1-deoxy-D-xylulose-5-phosphate reductoisomerase [Marinicella litoralis]TDR19476.1 1-deoxy-D-xylulose 5-phosphate reductoisomerase [Marinicella litoralis]
MKQVSVLGATGSIGDSTLAVIRKHLDQFKIHSLSAHTNVKKIVKLTLEFLPEYVVITDEVAYVSVKSELENCQTKVVYGTACLDQLVSESVVDLVVAGIVGNAGMPSVLAAVAAGKTLLLANKEAIVSAGHLVMSLAAKSGAKIIPLDSEHNAIYQCLGQQYQVGVRPADVNSITLTASGGPFWQKPENEFLHITPEQAVAHPKWDMGAKISVDSATLMNKGLEIIEAHWLFNMPNNDINVLVHPQSIIHSMVNFIDGSVLAQMGNPDMQIPISYGLGVDKRLKNDANFLNLLEIGSLTFVAADCQKFKCLQLARDAISLGGIAPAILNAANEVTVDAFLNRRIGFNQIAEYNDRMLNQIDIEAVESMEQLLQLDQQVRTQTNTLIKQKTNHQS